MTLERTIPSGGPAGLHPGAFAGLREDPPRLVSGKRILRGLACALQCSCWKGDQREPMRVVDLSRMVTCRQL